MFKRKSWVKLILPNSESRSLPIVSDAAIASRGVGEGKLIPVLILDTSARPDIDELVRVHQHLPPGDVVCQWCQRDGTKGMITLMLKFVRPAELVILLDFDIERQGALVDQILGSGAVYIQPGRPGDRLATTMANPRISVQIPDTGFQSEWERMFQKHIAEGFIRRGLGRRESKRAALMFIEEWRKFGRFRMQ